jgi:hypothetical protein
MASHTASELEMAATVFADAAHAIGLDPASVTPAPPQRQQTTEEVDEREPAYAQGGRGELRYTELTVLAHERANADEEGSAPFDLERDGGRAPVVSAAETAASAATTHDQPTEEFNVERDIESADHAAETSSPDVPFDFERELHDVRAA